MSYHTMQNHTIAAISTALGTGGISIVRISGPDAFSILASIFRPYSKNTESLKSHSITYGQIIDKKTNTAIDEVLVMAMKKPKTYTKEDVIEINCHGGILVSKRVLASVLDAGCLLATPGEFTKRAFLNGRIDLSQAEAVADIINAQTGLSNKNAFLQLEGRLGRRISMLRNSLLGCVATIEAAIDYPEADVESVSTAQISATVGEVVAAVDELLSSVTTGRIIKEGIRIAIIGRPNAGKSSLLNYFLDADRAIVTDIPGTTRDVLEERLDIDGIPFVITDTAGIRESCDPIEQIGIERSQKAAHEADLILYIIDVSKPLAEEDLSLIQSLKDTKTLIVLNKTDLGLSFSPDYVSEQTGCLAMPVSIAKQTGIAELISQVKDMFFSGVIGVSVGGDQIFVSSLRHAQSLQQAKQSLEMVVHAITDGMPQDLLSIDLQAAYTSLGDITGESVDEDLIDRIFSDFCLGK